MREHWLNWGRLLEGRGDRRGTADRMMVYHNLQSLLRIIHFIPSNLPANNIFLQTNPTDLYPGRTSPSPRHALSFPRSTERKIRPPRPGVSTPQSSPSFPSETKIENDRSRSLSPEPYYTKQVGRKFQGEATKQAGEGRIDQARNIAVLKNQSILHRGPRESWPLRLA